MLLKASAVTSLTDARYYAAKEVHYLGFNLEEGTPGYLDPMYMKAIREWVTGPKIVGEFSTLPVDHVVAAAEFFGLDAVQITAAHHLKGLEALATLEVILQVDANQPTEALEYIFRTAAPTVSCFLLDFSTNSDWDSALNDNPAFWNNLFEWRPTLLQADLSAAQLPGLLAQIKLGGLSLVGEAEERVGVKSFDQIEDIFDALEL